MHGERSPCYGARMSANGTGNGRNSADDDFERQMTAARQIMEDDWIVLRALALGDQYPEAAVEALLEMARQQARDRSRDSE